VDKTPLHLSGLGSVVSRYDAVISDVWGVLHNGLAANPGAPEALRQARMAGLPVVLLTNAPRPPESIREQLRGFGIADDSYDAIVSSGGVTQSLIEQEGDAPFFHLGPARDIPIFDGLAARPAPLEEARYILCTGLFNDETDAPEEYRPLLEKGVERGLKLYCANPDLVVERGTDLIPCAGALADLYEHMGGTAIWVGKPHPLVYERARAVISELAGRSVPANRIVCIGDAFRTDIAGAVANGHDSIMTLAGIHGHQIGLKGADFDRGEFARMIEINNARPTMSMVSLIW
jgi:HAD superfamily hydrolase (TIGR01459 family)